MIRLVSKRLCCGRCACTMRIASRQAAEHVLQLGQGDQPAVRLAQRGEVADLAHRDQPLVGRVALGHRPEQVDLLVRRGQPGQAELAQPAQLQPLGDLRVQAADQPVLGEARAVRAEREVVLHGQAADAGHGDRDPPERPRTPGRPATRSPIRAASASASCSPSAVTYRSATRPPSGAWRPARRPGWRSRPAARPGWWPWRRSASRCRWSRCRRCRRCRRSRRTRR